MRHDSTSLRICYVGGGTGGHIFPLFAIDTAVRSSGISYTRYFITGRSSRERQWLSGKDRVCRHIHGGKLRRYVSFRNICDLPLIGLGFLESFTLFLLDRPDVVFSKGGYVSVPPVLAARVLKIPVIIHESDLSLGLANRICSRYADTVCLNREETLETCSKEVRDKAVVTGLPSRDEWGESPQVDIYKHFGLKRDLPVITVIGGSLGAQRINGMIPQLCTMLKGKAQIVHQTGEGKESGERRDNYFPVPFVHDEYMSLLRSSLCVISRAGASAIADFLAAEVPMILIPLPLSASRGDQIENASLYGKKGCALVLENDSLSAQLLYDAVQVILKNEEKREEMKQQIQSMKRIHTAETIAQIIIKQHKKR